MHQEEALGRIDTALKDLLELKRDEARKQAEAERNRAAEATREEQTENDGLSQSHDGEEDGWDEEDVEYETQEIYASQQLLDGPSTAAGAGPEADAEEDCDASQFFERSYASKNVFWVPPEARWKQLQAQAKRPDIAKLIDDGMYAIERDNDRLKNVLPRDYARRGIPAERLGELIDLISGIGLGDKESRAKDILGRVYEYFLGKFAAAEGKLGGEFYTPRCVVKLLVEMIEPFKGRVYDPCCGSGGMFVQAERFVEAHEGKATDISIYGQESNPTTWKLANMNLALRGIEAHLGEKHADTFHNDLHKDLKADFILANPPFNVSDWGGDRRREDVRWKYGTPPVGNANYAWIQHFIHHLAPNGIAGFVMANGSMSSNSGGEGDIRTRLTRRCGKRATDSLGISTTTGHTQRLVSKPTGQVGYRQSHGGGEEDCRGHGHGGQAGRLKGHRIRGRNRHFRPGRLEEPRHLHPFRRILG